MTLTRLLQRLRRGGDEGSALILALVVVTAVGIMLSAALSFAGTGVGNSPHLRDSRNQTYYGQGAVDGAINNIRGSSIAGTTVPGATCPTFAPAVPASGQDPGADGATQFQVTCTGLDSGNTPGTDAPIFAIQTLGTGSTDGINTTGNDTLGVDGGVYSAGRINVAGGAHNRIAVEGTVMAAGGCTPTDRIKTTDTAGLQCNHAQPAGADPAYPPAVASASALSSLIGGAGAGADPAVTCNGNIATFSPGFYGEVPDTLVANASSCHSPSIYWFQPGFYYFDFTNASAGHTWNVNDVVGGTPTGNWGTPGKACDSSVDSNGLPTAPGVQFIFGGNSNLNFGNGDALELCGPNQAQSPGSKQSIALYGLSGNSNQGTSTPAHPTDVEGATASPTASPVLTWSSTSGSAADGAQTIGDGNVATGNLKNPAASLAYSGFSHVPDGSAITSVGIRLVRNVSSGSLKTENISYKFPDSNATSVDVSACASPCTKDITSQLASVVGNGHLGWSELKGLTLTYNAQAKSNAATDDVDGIALVVSYIPPTLEAMNISGAYFVNASPPHLSMQMHGTVYTPSVGMTVEDQNSGDVIFSRGVIVSNLQVDANPSFTQTAAPFQVPGVVSARVVKFTGQTRPDSSAGWTSIVQACVAYSDNNSSGNPGPALPGYTLTVKNWTVFRSGSDSGPTCS
jgi:hypothetical protein